MKKIILALLALALSISLCACGGNTDTDGTENTTTGEKTTETKENTSQTESEEEKALKARYEAASEYLAKYLEDGKFGFHDSKNNWNYYVDNAAAEYLYKEFEACGDYEDSEEILSQFATRNDGTYLYIPYAYKAANAYLAEYLEDGEFYDDDWDRYKDNAASEYLYKVFEACGDYEDSEEFLARFTVFPDMLTSITNATTNNLGNVKEGTYETYKYDAKGTSQDDPILELLSISDWRSMWNHNFEYEYDEADRIISVKLMEDGTVEAIVTPEYDANGNVVKATIQTNNGTYTSTYTYDEQNYLIAAEKYIVYSLGIDQEPCSYTYSYDASGKLIEESYSYTDIDGWYHKFKITYFYDTNENLIGTEENYSKGNKPDILWSYQKDTTHSYDENGYLIMKKETYTEHPGKNYERQTITQFLYTNDENGRPISAELIETKDGKNSYASQILTYNYETLYFYNAE